ncbi:Rid family hydrolase [Brachybacterium sp. DNPG3]
MASRAVTLNRTLLLCEDVPCAYSASVEPPARLIVLAGAAPVDKRGTVVGPGDVAAQTGVCVETLVIALAEAGATLEDVVHLRVLVATTDREDLAVAGGIVRQALGEHDAPHTLVGVTLFGRPDQLVEIEATAAVR